MEVLTSECLKVFDGNFSEGLVRFRYPWFDPVVPQEFLVKATAAISGIVTLEVEMARQAAHEKRAGSAYSL